MNTIETIERRAQGLYNPPITLHAPQVELTQPLEDLRRRVHAEMQVEIDNRISTNSFPIDEEIALGSFIEEIEPQVRVAVLLFNRRGYATNCSGFFHTHNDQTIYDYMNLVPDEVEVLETKGVMVKVEQNGYCSVSFVPDQADLLRLTKRWNEIAEAGLSFFDISDSWDCDVLGKILHARRGKKSATRTACGHKP